MRVIDPRRLDETVPGLLKLVFRLALLAPIVVLGLVRLDDGADTAIAQTCTPRPPVTVTTSVAGDGRLSVVVTAGAGSIQALRFEQLQNVRIDVGDRIGQRVPFIYAPSPQTPQVSFLLHRETVGPATVQRLVVVDACGEWRTFVGAGTGAWPATPTPTSPSVPTSTPTVNLTPTNTPTSTATPLPPTGLLAGVVTNGSTGQPIAGAQVRDWTGGGRATTAADGRYQLTLPTGSRTIELSADGFRTTSAAFTIQANATTNGSVSLTPIEVPPVGQWIGLGPEGANVEVLAFAPSDPSIVYAGTMGGGVFRSTDGARTWTGSTTGLIDGQVMSLAVDPRNPDVVFAGLVNGMAWTTDGGSTWQTAGNGAPSYGVTSIAFNPSNPAIMLTAGFSGLYRSMDNGHSWTASSSGLPLSGYVNATAVAMHPTRPNVAYTSVVSTSGGISGQVYQSDDGGVTWQVLPGSLSAGFQLLVVDPVTPTTIYGGGVAGLYRSIDAGATWVNHPLPPNAGLIRALTVSRSTPSILYAVLLSTTGGQVLKSSDGGQSWVPVSAPSHASGTSLLIDPSAPQTLYLGGQHGVLKTSDGGATWAVVNAGLRALTISAVVADPRTPNTIYAGTQNNLGIFKTVDGGWSWRTVNTGLLAQDVYAPSVSSLVIDPSAPDTVLAATSGGVFKTVNGGESWVAAGTGLPTTTMLRVLGISRTSPSILYLATAHAGVYKSTDGGQSWVSVNNGIGSTDILTLAVDPTNANVAYAGLNQGGVYKTVDGGMSWRLVRGAITVFSFGIDQRAPSTIYAALNQSGFGCTIFRSDNGGDTWSVAHGGMTGASVTGMVFDSIDPNHLYATTTGGGVWSSGDRGQNWSQIGQSSDLDFNESLGIAGNYLIDGTRGAGVFRLRLR